MSITFNHINRQDIDGTCHQSTHEATYDQLVKTFGQPTVKFEKGDHDKVDVSWYLLMTDPHTGEKSEATIYNYKDGRNYLRELGADVEEITMWHFGGFSDQGTLMAYMLVMATQVNEGHINEAF